MYFPALTALQVLLRLKSVGSLFFKSIEDVAKP